MSRILNAVRRLMAGDERRDAPVATGAEDVPTPSTSTTQVAAGSRVESADDMANASQMESPQSNQRNQSGRTSSRSLWSDGIGRAALRSIQALAVLAVVALVVYIVLTLSIVTVPVLLALIVASAIVPFTSWLQRHRVPSMLATWVALISIIVLIGLVVWLIVWAVTRQWSNLVDSVQQGVGSLQSWLAGLPFDVSLPNLHALTKWATDIVSSSGFQSGAIAGMSAAGEFFTSFGVFVVVLFFFLKDGPAMWEFLLRPFTGAGYERGLRTGRKAVDTFGGYLRGTTIVAAADAIGIGIGLFILQVPLALPLAVIVFITAYIPIVGATIAGILAALVALVTNGLVPAIIVVAIVVLVNQLEGNFLQPVVMGRTLKLHPLIILIALTIGTTLGGILGAIIAVPLTATAWAVLQVWDGPHTPARFVRAKPEVKQRIGE